jgi:hypothetical protein
MSRKRFAPLYTIVFELLHIIICLAVQITLNEAFLKDQDFQQKRIKRMPIPAQFFDVNIKTIAVRRAKLPKYVPDINSHKDTQTSGSHEFNCIHLVLLLCVGFR